MIPIRKNPCVPAVLTCDETNQSLSDLDNKVATGTELTTDDFDKDIYGHQTVRDQLMSDQNYKCAYCESTLVGSYSDVEHFRPKTGYNQSKGDSLTKPGYYWLAYTWSNLLYSCNVCNRTYKKNLFPLEDSTTRDISHKNIANEVPLFINPSQEDPADYIEFHHHIICPIHTNGVERLKGKVTIGYLGLNERKDLKEVRRRLWLKAVKLKIQYMADGIPESDAIQRILDQYGTDDMPYAGMFRFQKRW